MYSNYLYFIKMAFKNLNICLISKQKTINNYEQPIWGWTPPKRNYFLEGGLLVVLVFLARSVFLVYQLVFLWEAEFGCGEFCEDSTHLLISWWVIYECTCLPAPTVQQLLTKNIMTPMPRSPCSSYLTPSDLFLFPWMKKVHKRKRFADMEEVKQQMAEAPEGIKSSETVLSIGKIVSIYIAIKWRAL